MKKTSNIAELTKEIGNLVKKHEYNKALEKIKTSSLDNKILGIILNECYSDTDGYNKKLNVIFEIFKLNELKNLVLENKHDEAYKRIKELLSKLPANSSIKFDTLETISAHCYLADDIYNKMNMLLEVFSYNKNDMVIGTLIHKYCITVLINTKSEIKEELFTKKEYYELLVKADKLIPEESIIQYNLALYNENAEKQINIYEALITRIKQNYAKYGIKGLEYQEEEFQIYIACLNKISSKYVTLDNYNKAIYHANNVLKLGITGENLDEALENLIEAHFHLNQLDKAKEYNQQIGKSGSNKNYSFFMLMRIMLQESLSNHKLYIKGLLTLYNKEGYRDEVFLKTISHYYAVIAQDYNSALKYYLEVYETSKSSITIKSLYNISSLYKLLGDKTQYNKYNKKFQKLKKAENSKNSSTLLNLASVGMGNAESYKEIEEKYSKNLDDPFITNIYITYLYCSNKYSDLIPILLSNNQLAKDYNYYDFLGTAYLNLHNYQNAYAIYHDELYKNLIYKIIKF